MIRLGEDKIRSVENMSIGMTVKQGETLVHGIPNYVDGTPVMTSNNTPSPYVTYTNSVFSTYAAWKAFNNSTSEADRWVCAANTFDSNGISVGTYPYLWLNLANSTNAKKYSKIEVTIRNTDSDWNNAPRILSLGYSNDNSSYVYQRFSDLTKDVWIAHLNPDGITSTLTFYFNAPDTAMQYWSLTVIETNNNSNIYTTTIQIVKYFIDSNNP